MIYLLRVKAVGWLELPVFFQLRRTWNVALMELQRGAGEPERKVISFTFHSKLDLVRTLAANVNG